MNSSEHIERYLQSCRTEFWQGIFQFEIEYLLRHLEGFRKVLSVGCGPAIIEIALCDAGFQVTGLDVSRETLERAPDGIRAVVAHAGDMPFPESSFDAVIYVASLQFIKDYREALENTARVLRPAGKLIVMLLNPESVFFKEKFRDPGSYVSRIRHTDLGTIENVIAGKFKVRTEYFLGVKGNAVFESHKPAESVLYNIVGERKLVQKDPTA